MIVIRTVFCVGSAKFTREIAALIGAHTRLRWVADASSLQRNLAIHRDAVACIVEHSESPDLMKCLDMLARQSPAMRRLLVIEACNLMIVRSFLHTQLVHVMLYRPLDAAALINACGLRARSIPQQAV